MGTLVLIDVDHVQPVHDHHRFDQIAAEVAMAVPFVLVMTRIRHLDTACHQERAREERRGEEMKDLPAVIHVRLHTHVVRSQVLDAPSAILNPHAVFIDAQRLVALTHQPLVGLIPAGRVGRHDQTRPQRGGVVQVRELLGRGRKDGVNPIDMRLQIEVVPETVAEDEGRWSVGLARAEIFFEARDFFVGDGMSHHDLDHDVDFVRIAHEALRVLFEDVARLEYALDGTGLDVELVVAETFTPGETRRC